VPPDDLPDSQSAGFELLQERRPEGLVGRALVTTRHMLGLLFGGAFAYVRQQKAYGQAGTFELVLLRIGLVFVWPFMDKTLIRQPFPVQFRRRLELLGPTYIKLGQILSLREELLPKPLTDELKNLLDRLPAVPYGRFKELIELDLQRPADTIFPWIEPVPLGSASLAQSHRAILTTYEIVVLKVLKPGVRVTVERDLRLLRLAGRVLQLFLARYQPARLINEFSSYTLKEVDLRFEAENAETFAVNFKDEPDVCFPKIYREFSNRDVLCMEYFEGDKPSPSAVAKLSTSQKNKVINLGVGAIIRMIFRDGFFHADLHPANLIIFDDARVGFIDLGMVGRFDSDMQKRLLYYSYSLVVGDAANAARYITSIAFASKESDTDGFRRAAEDLYRRWLRSPNIHNFSMAQVILESVILAGRYRIQYPGEFILMTKALLTLEGVGNMIEPGIDLTTAARGHVQKIVLQQYNPASFVRDSLLLFPELVDLLNRSPLVLSEGLRVIEKSLKQPQSRSLAEIRGPLLAGVAAAILVAFGGPWPLWVSLFIIAFVLAVKS
jgi:ubiquinone biosynthesis protein